MSRRKKGLEENIAIFSHFAIDTLAVHNEYRRKHGVPALVLSQKLCKFSQDWADFCAKKSILEHRKNGPYGENLYTMYSSDLKYTPSARDAVKDWYDEIKQFTFGVEDIQEGTLHFTQLIWKGSRELGVGRAKTKKGETYIVTNYDPKGNYKGEFVENVPRPISASFKTTQAADTVDYKDKYKDKHKEEFVETVSIPCCLSQISMPARTFEEFVANVPKSSSPIHRVSQPQKPFWKRFLDSFCC